MEFKRTDPVATTLPPAAREMLIAAARIADEHVRRIAIDSTIETIKARWPQHFRGHGQEDD